MEGVGCRWCGISSGTLPRSQRPECIYRRLNSAHVSRVPRYTGLTAAECCSKCVRNTNCSAYTHNNAECILKDQTLKNSTNPPRGRVCISGQVRPGPPSPSPSPTPHPGPPPTPTPPPSPAPPGSKNVLFLVVDDLRNELGFTNKRDGIITPNLDALANKSMVSAWRLLCVDGDAHAYVGSSSAQHTRCLQCSSLIACH